MSEEQNPKKLFETLVGSWEGNCSTWFKSETPDDESSVSGEFEFYLGAFIRHKYNGSILGRPRTGEELIAYNSVENLFQISWVDDFHSSSSIMFSQGVATSDGFAVLGIVKIIIQILSLISLCSDLIFRIL